MSKNIQRCKACGGTKKCMGLGMIMKDCQTCMGVGWLVDEPVVEVKDAEVKVATKTKSDKKCLSEDQTKA